jgi:hypothetical protein
LLAADRCEHEASTTWAQSCSRAGTLPLLRKEEVILATRWGSLMWA